MAAIEVWNKAAVEMVERATTHLEHTVGQTVYGVTVRHLRGRARCCPTDPPYTCSELGEAQAAIFAWLCDRAGVDL